ncbi:hypothetical protein OsJ_25300 [Oryza sativa Japonica Group]|uniref:Plant heme peroxidase family profile domain-containing protein n=1 Tax=Oryza sativa subsp. japonica TaxID=39947 RepID=B9FUG4_ORYSJ|nr:hypothetical protein OsJ_25300 [Oryza sativa Japonica Group]
MRLAPPSHRGGVPWPRGRRHYRRSCPKAEALVRAEVKKAVVKNAGAGAGLIRMLFHDCFVEVIKHIDPPMATQGENVLARRVLFASDAALLSSPATARMVRANARLPASWEKKFARAMVRMASIELKAAHRGEIRKNCRVVN